jgi:hypothetical protein
MHASVNSAEMRDGAVVNITNISYDRGVSVLRSVLVLAMLAPTACVGEGVAMPESGTSGDIQHETSEGSTYGSDSTTAEDDDGWSDDGNCGWCGCAAICPPDGGTATFECDLWGQDCPRGQKCSPWDNTGVGAWNASKCTTLDPNPDAVGEPCTVEGSAVSGVDSCELGALCWAVDEVTFEGTCVQQCLGTEVAPLCPEGTSCTIANGGALNLCLPSCDPLGEPCEEGSTCRPTQMPGSFTCVPVGGRGVVHDGCGGCGWGEVCVTAEAQLGCDDAIGCCTVYCDLDDPGSDDACDSMIEGHACVPHFETEEELDHVGVCGVPT